MKTLDEIRALYQLPLFELISKSRALYLEHWKNAPIQLCSLLSIKTGGCSEDCSYCSQSSHHSTPVEKEELLDTKVVLEKARSAKASGASRFCMGAAWRGIKENDSKMDQVVEIARGVKALDMEVCMTLGKLTEGSAKKLKEAGVTSYNHNIDTSPEFYPKIVTTHTFEDRLQTIRYASKAGMKICCGGIIGLGETIEDRLKMLQVISTFDPPPESVPINSLQTIQGTPLEKNASIDSFDLVRLIAVTRLCFPSARVRLSAGRRKLSREAQALCFFAGANSIFYGGKLLTASNPDCEEDLSLLSSLGLKTQESMTPAA